MFRVESEYNSFLDSFSNEVSSKTDESISGN
jgi:hypothetical protein